MYSVTGAQDSATPGRWLFNLQYNPAPTLGGATAAGGGRILSNAFLDANATGLTLTAQAGASSTARGLVASATGGATNYAIEINGGSLKINTIDGLLFGTAGVVSAVTVIPNTVTIPAAQVTGITQYSLAVGGATGLTSLPTGNLGDILVSNGAGSNPSFNSVGSVLGTNVVLYGPTTAQSSKVADGSNYLMNVAYNGTATGAALGAVITSDAVGGVGNRAATGLTVNSLPAGTGIVQGIVVNTNAVGADLVINEDAITRAGSLAINVGAGNTLSTNGNVSADGDLTLGTSAVAGGSIVWNDNTAGASFNGTMQGPTLYTAARTYTLPDADGTFMLSTGALGANRFLYSNGSGQVAFTGLLSDGMLLIGDGAGAPVAATLSGTRGITITNGAGAITIGMPTAVTTGSVLRYNGTNWVETGANFTIDGFGNTVNAGTLNVNGATTLGNGDAGDFLTINTGGAADLTIAEDAITRAGSLAINVGAGNTLSTNGNVSADGDLTLGTSAVAGGSIVWNDNTAGASFNGTMQGPTLYTAARTYTLPDADGTFMLSTGALGANRFLYSNGSGQVAFTGLLSDGMLLIGDGAGAPVAATLSGTRGITITNGAGAITIGMPTAVTTGSVLRYNGTNWVETGATFTVDGSGNTVTQGDATFGTGSSTTGGSLILHDNDGGTAFTASIVGPTTLGSNQTYTLPATGGTFLTDANGWATTGNGHTVTDGTNNLLGTTTAAGLRIITGSGGPNTRVLISAAGDITMNGTAGTPNVTVSNLGGTAKSSVPVGYDRIVLASNTGSMDEASFSAVIGSAAVLYGSASAQNTATPVTANLFNVSYAAGAGNAAGATINSSTTAGTANGLTVTAGGTTTNTGITVNATTGSTNQGIVVNTNAVGADLVINEDAITRAGSLAINVGAGNTLSTNGNVSADGDLTLGTSAVAGGSIVWNDNTAGASFNGTMQGPTLYTAARTYTLPDADGTFMLSTGALGANRFLYSNGSGQVAFTGLLSDGMLLIGDGAGAPVAATLSGTRGITITNGAGAITIGMPTAVTTGSVLRYNGTNWVETGATFTVDGSGNTVTQGDATFGTGSSTTGGSLILHDNDGGTAFTASIVGPTTLGSNQTYTLPATGGTFLTDANGWATTGNGHTVTDGTNNLIGTTTAAPIRLVTGVGGTTRLTISATGDFTFAGTGGTSNVTMTSLSGATFGAALGANEGIVIASATGELSKRSVANVIGSSVVLYNQTAAQNTATADGTAYLFNTSYLGAGNTGAGLGGVITSTPTGAANANATGLTINAVPTGAGVAQGIVVNTGAGADLVINEDAITRAGSLAINVGAGNTLSTNGNVSADGDLTLGTSAVAGGSIVWNDNTAGASFNGTMQGPTLYTAARTYTLPDADGTFMLSTGALGANRFLYSNGSGQVAFTGALSDGMLLIGDGAGAPVAATLSGTRGITITNGAGAITIGMPTATTTGSVLRYNGTNWVETGATFTVDGSGNTVTQGDATFGTSGSTTGGGLILHDNNAGTLFTATINGPTVLASDQTYTLPAVGGTFLTDANGWATTGNGHTVTDGTNNLIGTTTAAPIRLVTGVGGVTRLTISATGDFTFAGTGGTSNVTMTSLSGATFGATLGVNEGIVIASATGVLSKRSVANVIGSSVVLYNQTAAQTAAVSNGTNYLYNVAYDGAGTGAALGAVITSNATGAVNAAATGLTVNATATGTGIVQGIVVNTAGGADLVINEDAITRAGSLAINVGAGNTLSTNGNVSADGDLTLGTSAVAGGSIVWNDNTAGASFNGTMQGPLLYTATRTYTLPDADGTFMLSTGALGANRFLYSNGSGQVAFTGALSDGMLLIGDGAGAPVAATLSGTRGITITNGAGAITIGMPTATTTGSVLRYNGTNWVETGATFTVDGSGNTVTQGDATFGTSGSTTGGGLILHDNNAGTLFTATINGPTVLASDQTYTLPAVGGTFLTDANGWATTGNGHTVTDGTNNLIGPSTAAPLHLITGGTAAANRRVTITAAGDMQVNYKLILAPPASAPGAISGAVGGAISITTSYADQSVTPANTSGGATNITLPAGTDGQVAYLRLSVVNAAGNAAINLVNSDATNIEVFAQGVNYERVLHMIYKTGGTAKWVVLSNVAP